MRFYVNDIAINIVSGEEEGDISRYQEVIESGQDHLDPIKLFHHVLVKNADFEIIDDILQLMNVKILRNLYSITFAVRDKEATKQYVKSKFKIVKAAGGLVRKNSKVLMIYRLKKWDLPKGKINKKEKAKEAAVREVKEECNIQVKLDYKICATWHTYTMNGKRMMKKTNWYAMTCKDDKNMKPQSSEDIEEVQWLGAKDIYVSLKNSYRSVVDVFEKYHEINHEMNNG